jgi:ribosomal protein L7Ae-like RNA K-turn-binding protein
MINRVIASAFALALAASTLINANKTMAADSAPPENGVVVYYFHNTFRCMSCNSIESLLKAAILGGKGENTKHKTAIEVTPAYADELKTGKLAFVSLNADEKENGRLLTKLKAKPKIPVIVVYKNGKFSDPVSLPEVWNLLNDNAKFVAFIRKNVSDALKKLSNGNK